MLAAVLVVSWLCCFVAVEWPRVRATDRLPPSITPQDDIGHIRAAGLVSQLAAIAYAVAGWAPITSDVVSMLAGVTLMAIGAALRLHCFARLGDAFTLDVRAHSSQPLVTSGAYRWVRHPAYLGGLLTLVGFGYALNSWAAVAQLLSTGLVIYLRRIEFEEDALRLALGRTYARYCYGRSRLVPYLY